MRLHFYNYNQQKLCEKGNLDGKKEIIRNLLTKQSRRSLKENTGSDKGKLVPTDMEQ
jgi:hypothetical protein